MFGDVTALQGLHVAWKYKTQHDAHMLHACGLGSSQCPCKAFFLAGAFKYTDTHPRASSLLYHSQA